MKIVNASQALEQMKRIQNTYAQNEFDVEEMVIELLEIQPHLKRMERSFSCTTKEYKGAVEIFNRLRESAYRCQRIRGEYYLGPEDLHRFELSSTPDESPFNIVSVQRKPDRD